MDIEEYMHQKVKIFKNKTYFELFQTILINLSKNITIYRKQYSLSGRMENNNILNNSRVENVSIWFYIMKIVLDKLKTKEKAFFIKNNLNVNPLIFSYLVKLCKIKMNKLEKLSIIENAPMDKLIRLYLDLCLKEINPDLSREIDNEKSLLPVSDNKNNKTTTKKSNQVKGTESKNKKEEEDTNENVKKKYGIGKVRLTYNRSLCRLFIGETDEKSVQKKHLMSITVKKDRSLKINGIQMGKSESYVKRIINEIGEEKGHYLDDDLHKILNKFKREQKFLEEYRKNIKLEQSEKMKKFKTNKVKNKSIKLISLNTPKGIYKSPTQSSFRSFQTIKSNSRRYISNNFFSSNNNKKKDKKIYINLFAKTPLIKKRLVFSGMQENKKVPKITLERFKKYNTGNYTSRKVDFYNYFINKKDFFYNNEFEI